MTPGTIAAYALLGALSFAAAIVLSIFVIDWWIRRRKATADEHESKYKERSA